MCQSGNGTTCGEDGADHTLAQVSGESLSPELHDNQIATRNGGYQHSSKLKWCRYCCSGQMPAGNQQTQERYHDGCQDAPNEFSVSLVEAMPQCIRFAVLHNVELPIDDINAPHTKAKQQAVNRLRLCSCSNTESVLPDECHCYRIQAQQMEWHKEMHEFGTSGHVVDFAENIRNFLSVFGYVGVRHLEFQLFFGLRERFGSHQELDPSGWFVTGRPNRALRQGSSGGGAVRAAGTWVSGGTAFC